MMDEQGVHILARALGVCLEKKGMLVATAESCTGGLLAGALTSVPGSSNWFDQGWVTYTNKAKVSQLGVAPQILRDFGAVSEPVARQMAAGALAMAPKAHLSFATTGIAGPGGGSEDKPVGLVWFAFARRIEDAVVVTACSHVFEGNRAQVRDAAVNFSIGHALQMLDLAA